MKAETARRLAVRISRVMERWDHWSYADALFDYDNNEELLLEQVCKDILDAPEMVMDSLLETMEVMLDEMEV